MIVSSCQAGNGEDAPAVEAGSDADEAEEADETPEGEGDSGQDEPDELGYLRFADLGGVDTLDPDRSIGGNQLPPLLLTYDRLIHVDPSTGTLVPGLAESWSFASGDELILELRENVQFHDGVSFNAEAVLANLERSNTLEGRSGVVEAAMGSIGEVEAIDELTVRIVKDPDASNLAWSLIESQLGENVGMMISPEAIESADLDSQPVGAGMMTVEAFSPGEQVDYVAFDDYWDSEALRLSGMEWTFINDSRTRFNAVLAGEVDLTFIEPGDIPEAEEAGLDIAVETGLEVVQVFLNHSMPPLDDANVRRALQVSVDRAGIVEGLTFGTGEPTTQIFPPNYEGFNDEYGSDYYEFDPDRAMQLLEESGSTDINLSMFVINRPRDIQLGEAVQAGLQQAGIDLEVVPIEAARAGEYLDGEAHMILGRRGRLDALAVLDLSFATDGGWNPGGTNTEAIQGLLAEAASLPEGEERWQVIRQLSGEIAEEGLVLPLFASGTPWAQSGCVDGFEPSLVNWHTFRGVSVASDC